MLKSIELQGVAMQAQSETALVVTALEAAAGVVPCDYENLESHVAAAVSILKANVERLGELADALVDDFLSEDDEEGVA